MNIKSHGGGSKSRRNGGHEESIMSGAGRVCVGIEGSVDAEGKQREEISNLGNCQECFKETLNRIQTERMIITREINLSIKSTKDKENHKQHLIDESKTV